MKRYFFLFVIALFGGALVFQWLLRQPSYLMVVVGNTSIEMSLWLAIGLTLGGLLILWISYRLTGGSWNLLKRSFHLALFGSETKVRRQISDGLINYLEGNWKPALKQLTRTAPKAEEPLLNYIAAATSAFELGDDQRANELLAKADQSKTGAELAVILTQARYQLRGNKYEQCAATLERARKLAPRHPVVLDLQRQVYMALHDWTSLESILPQLERYKIVQGDPLRAIKKRLYVELLHQAAQSDSPAEQLRARWQRLPTIWQLNVDLILEYCDALLGLGDSVEAELLLRKNLQRNWDDRLIERYGIVEGRDTNRQLLEAESWLKERPGNAQLLLTLGRLALRNQLWGKARDYFASSLKIKGSAGAYAEMARLLAHLGEHEKSTEYYQRGLLNFTSVLPNVSLPEKS